MARDLFYFFRSYRDAMDEMDDAMRGHFVKALADFALDGRVPTFDNPTERMMWAIMMPNFERNLQFADEVEAKREARREAGRKGGKVTGREPWNKGASQAEAKQTPSKSQANAKQKPSKSQAEAKQGVEDTKETSEKCPSDYRKNGTAEQGIETYDSTACEMQSQANAKQKPSKAKQIIDNRLMIIDNSVVADTRTREDEFGMEMRNSATCMEECARLFQLPSAEVASLMDTFATEVRATGSTHDNASQYRRHFVNWARIHIKAETNGNTTRNIHNDRPNGGTSKAEFNAALADHFRTEEFRAERGMAEEIPDI
jgi:hypothetical protein